MRERGNALAGVLFDAQALQLLPLALRPELLDIEQAAQLCLRVATLVACCLQVALGVRERLACLCRRCTTAYISVIEPGMKRWGEAGTTDLQSCQTMR